MLLTLRQGRLLYGYTSHSHQYQIDQPGAAQFQSQRWPKGKSKETGVFDDAHLLCLDNRVQLSNTLSQLISPVRLVLSAAVFELVLPARPNTFHLEQSTQD
jgi:hypothetical protein